MTHDLIQLREDANGIKTHLQHYKLDDEHRPEERLADFFLDLVDETLVDELWLSQVWPKYVAASYHYVNDGEVWVTNWSGKICIGTRCTRACVRIFALLSGFRLQEDT